MPRKRDLAQDQQQREETTTRQPVDGSPARPPEQRGWKHDNVAGVERSYYTDSTNGIYEAWFKFRDGRPPQKIIDLIRENGYRPKQKAPGGGRWPEVLWAWAKPTNYETLNQDRLNHERLFDKIVELMRADKGMASEPSQEMSF